LSLNITYWSLFAIIFSILITIIHLHGWLYVEIVMSKCSGVTCYLSDCCVRSSQHKPNIFVFPFYVSYYMCWLVWWWPKRSIHVALL